MNYIVQEKSRAEDALVTSVALIRKHVKDYNELLRFTKEMKSHLVNLNNKLKSANSAKPAKEKPVLKDTQLLSYAEVDKLSSKSIVNELKYIKTEEDKLQEKGEPFEVPAN